MPGFLAEFISQLSGIWGRLDGGQRLTIGSVVLAAVVGLGAIIWVAGQPDYVTAFHAEDAQSLDDAVRALSSSGIGYKEDGSSLLVERSEMGRAKNALFRAGVAGGSPDPERDNMGMSSVTQDALSRRDGLMAKNNRRAEKAVEMMPDVIQAYVSASKPKRSVYTMRDAETRPSATVTVKLRAGAAFSRVARAAIVQVAAQTGIPEANVQVVNASTNQTFSLEGRGHDIGGSEFLAQQRKRSADLTDLAQAWLDRLYEGKAIVTVSVDLDPAYTSSEEKIQPTKPAVVSEDSTEDSTTGGASAGPGAGDPSVSTAANGGGAVNSGAVAAAGASSNQKSKTKSKTYEPFAGVRRSGMLTPDLRRMTIALVVDKTIGEDQARIANIENAIKSTVGWLGTRPSGLSDSFETLVEEFPELAELESSAAAGPDMIALAREFGPLAGQVIGVVLVLLFLKKLLAKNAGGSKAGGASLLAANDDSGSEGSAGGGIDDEDFESLAPDERRKRLRREIEASIADDPATVTRLLEGWLAEQNA